MPNQPPPNQLEQDFARANEDPSLRGAFLRNFCEYQVFIMQPEKEHPGDQSPPNPTDNSFRTFTLRKDGVHFIPIFSSLARIPASFQHGYKHKPMSVRELFSMTNQAHFVLNPGSEHVLEFTPEQVRQLLHAKEENAITSMTFSIARDAGVRVQHPNENHKVLINELAQYFRTQISVQRAYMALYQCIHDCEPPHLLVAAETTDTSDHIPKAIRKIGLSTPFEDPPLDIFMVKPGAHQNPKLIISDMQLIYVSKQPWWRFWRHR